MTGFIAFRNARPENAIDEYSRHLVRALRQAGVPVGYAEDGLASFRRGAGPDWVLLQYSPFSYGRWGVAPGLLRDAVALRRRHRRTRFAVMVHEAWMPMQNWRWALMSAYQRLQLASLVRLADHVLVSGEALARRFRRGVIHVPVGSNISPVVATAAEARHRLGLGDGLIVALFGTAHPSRALDHAEAAIAALVARRRGSVRVLNLGRDAQALDVPPEVEVHTPGRLDAAELSLRLRASDVLLLPFVDGLSTRRSTLMAGLAHGVAVIGLRGVNTDRVLAQHPEAISLTPAGDPAAFARATVELVDSPARRREMGAAGRQLYAREFDWPVLASRVIAALGLVGRPAVPNS